MTSPRVFHALGAYQWRNKIITLAEEVQRRMMNMDRAHTPVARAKMIQDLIQKMSNSEYNAKARREIVVSGLKRYYRLVKDQ